MGKCKNCGLEVATHDFTMRQKCGRELLQKMMAKLSVIAITVLLFVGATSMAYSEQIVQIFDGTGQPIILPDQSVAILQINSGTYLHGTVVGTTQITSTLSNFLSSTSENGITTFSGVTPSYQVQLTIGSKTIIIQPTTSQVLPLGLSQTDVLLLIGIIGAVALTFVVVIHKRANY